MNQVPGCLRWFEEGFPGLGARSHDRVEGEGYGLPAGAASEAPHGTGLPRRAHGREPCQAQQYRTYTRRLQLRTRCNSQTPTIEAPCTYITVRNPAAERPRARQSPHSGTRAGPTRDRRARGGDRPGCVSVGRSAQRDADASRRREPGGPGCVSVGRSAQRDADASRRREPGACARVAGASGIAAGHGARRRPIRARRGRRPRSFAVRRVRRNAVASPDRVRSRADCDRARGGTARRNLHRPDRAGDLRRRRPDQHRARDSVRRPHAVRAARRRGSAPPGQSDLRSRVVSARVRIARGAVTSPGRLRVPRSPRGAGTSASARHRVRTADRATGAVAPADDDCAAATGSCAAAPRCQAGGDTRPDGALALGHRRSSRGRLWPPATRGRIQRTG